MDGSEETSGRRLTSASPAAGGAGFSGSIDFSRGPNGCTSSWDQKEEEEEKKEEFVREEEKEELRRFLSSGSGGSGAGDVSLREWLDRPGRAVELLECLHVFQQVLEAVGAAHEQGVVVGNVLPSRFVMSPSNRVAFIESATCSTSGLGGSSCSSEGEGTGAPPEGPSSDSRLRDADGNAEKKKTFPTKRILLMESSWYTSPEEADGAPGTFASDVFRLGVLLFEVVVLLASGSSTHPLLDRAHRSFLCSCSMPSTHWRRNRPPWLTSGIASFLRSCCSTGQRKLLSACGCYILSRTPGPS